MEQKALALFGTAPYTSTTQAANSKTDVIKVQNTSTTESEHNAEVESMLQEVQFSDVEPDNIIVRKRSISMENHNPHHGKSIKVEKKPPLINKKTIIFDFDASDENIDEEAARFIVDGIDTQKRTSRHIEDETLTNEQSIHTSPKKITLTQDIEQPTVVSEAGYHSSIAYQLKRIADVKEEKLKFEIAKYKYNNPGFKYQYHGTEGAQEEPQEDVLVSVFNEAHY